MIKWPAIEILITPALVGFALRQVLPQCGRLTKTCKSLCDVTLFVKQQQTMLLFNLSIILDQLKQSETTAVQPQQPGLIRTLVSGFQTSGKCKYVWSLQQHKNT